MKIEHYIKKLEKSPDYKAFVEKEPKAYMCSIFLVRDFEGNHSETQVDFYSPQTKKITSFKINGKVEKVAVDKKAENLLHKKFIPKKLVDGIKLDVDELSPTILDEMHNRGLTDNIKKILVVLQNVDDRNVWNCTCFLSGLGLLQSHVEDKSGTVLFMEKRSFFDMIKLMGGGPEQILQPGKKLNAPAVNLEEPDEEDEVEEQEVSVKPKEKDSGISKTTKVKKK